MEATIITEKIHTGRTERTGHTGNTGNADCADSEGKTKKSAYAAANSPAGRKPYTERAGHRMKIGKKGEQLAASHLELAGYEILHRNYTCRIGEIDIIARPRNVNMLCFIEVKCRGNDSMGRPYEAVGRRKQKHYRQVATVYLMREWEGLDADATTEYRFDVIEVVLRAGKPEINHIPGAF